VSDAPPPPSQATGPPPAAPRGSGVLKWVLIAAGALLLACGCGTMLVLRFARDWFEVALAPPGEREARLSRKLESIVGDQVACADRFVAAVDAGRDDDAWAMTTDGFRTATSREKFGELTATVRSVLGRCTARQVQNVQTRSSLGAGPSTTSLVFAATFEKGAGTIKFDLVSGDGGWSVSGWRTESPLFLDAIGKGAGK
jgi:hypothetical protein